MVGLCVLRDEYICPQAGVVQRNIPPMHADLRYSDLQRYHRLFRLSRTREGALALAIMKDLHKEFVVEKGDQRRLCMMILWRVLVRFVSTRYLDAITVMVLEIGRAHV